MDYGRHTQADLQLMAMRWVDMRDNPSHEASYYHFMTAEKLLNTVAVRTGFTRPETEARIRMMARGIFMGVA